MNKKQSLANYVIFNVSSYFFLFFLGENKEKAINSFTQNPITHVSRGNFHTTY